MTEIIFTYRPLTRKPISWINQITRWISKADSDHVSINRGGIIYESVSGKGVHSTPIEEWFKGREGTELTIYLVPDEYVDLDYFKAFKGRKYDYRSALNHFFKRHKAMERKKYKKFTCSEFVAMCMHMDKHWEALPVDVERHCQRQGFESYQTIIEHGE